MPTSSLVPSAPITRTAEQSAIRPLEGQPLEPMPRFRHPSGEYQHVYAVWEWGWSSTFGRWGASVVFPDGSLWFTWPDVMLRDRAEHPRNKYGEGR